MTIRKGEEWGRHDKTPASFIIAEDDKDAATQPPQTPFALCRGDMFTALGRPRLPVHHEECMVVTIDALMCNVTSRDGSVESLNAFSHVSIGSWWKGRHIIVSNSGFLSGMNITPRSHPNDGEFDVFSMDAHMPIKQRFLARRKSKTGTHVPHPNLSIVRGTTRTFSREKPQERLSIDGVAVPGWTEINISIHPDYWEVIL